MNGIYWIEENHRPTGLAIVSRPRGADWLEGDLASVKSGGIDVLVSLLEPEEAEALGLSEEAVVARSLGMQFISYPIPDRSTPPDPTEFQAFVLELRDLARAGKNIGAHCRGCIGRSTVLIASIMIAMGRNPDDVLRLIERSRGCMVPDTPEQREWILNLCPTP